MPELKKFTVFGSEGKIGTLSAPARFLDSRSEKTITLDTGGEMTVASAALQVQPDGSFFFNGPAPAQPQPEPQRQAIPAAAPQVESQLPAKDQPMNQPVHQSGPDLTKFLGGKLYRDGYSIERVKIDRLVTEPVSQRQEGDTLILPVLEEVLVMEKRTMLREEIRITRSRNEVEDVQTVDPTESAKK